MDNFKNAFIQKVIDSRYNTYGLENYDEFRYGKSTSFSLANHYKEKLKDWIRSTINYRKEEAFSIAEKYYLAYNSYHNTLEGLYERLNIKDKNLFVSLLVYRKMGSKRVKLPRNNKKYWKAIKTAKKLKKLDEKHDPNFMPYVLEKFDLSLIGYDLRLYFSDVGIAIDFIIEQYAYKNGKTIIEANKGDVVLDIGGYWGDTALYFAHKVGNDGKVFSFEFIPDNLKLHEINTDLNQTLKKRIEVINHPVSDKTEDTIYYKDDGPGSRIQDKPFLGQTGSTTTITIDDFVQQNNLDRVDFIKMDIEGAENLALKGAIQTIKKYRPKLAIAIYHSIDDLINIPKWVLELNLDYEIFIDHYTIHQEETILFARPKND